MDYSFIKDYLEIYLSRKRCPKCFETYSGEACLIEIDAPGFVRSLFAHSERIEKPIFKHKKYDIKKFFMPGTYQMVPSVNINLICFECGHSIRVVVNLDNKAFKHGKVSSG